MNNVYFSTKLFQYVIYLSNYQSVNSRNKFYHLSNSSTMKIITIKIIILQEGYFPKIQTYLLLQFHNKKIKLFLLGPPPRARPREHRIPSHLTPHQTSLYSKTSSSQPDEHGAAGDLLQGGSEDSPFFSQSIAFVGREQIVSRFAQTNNSAQHIQQLGAMRNVGMCVSTMYTPY